jgi:hypothetical protein
MAAGTVNDYAASILKTLYSSDGIENATLGISPAYGQIKKDEKFHGYDFRELVFYGELQGVGHVFSGAQSAIGNPADAVFTLTRKETYTLAALDNWLIEAAEGGDRASFVSALKRHMDSALRAFGQTESHALYRDKFACRGTGTVATTTVTLTNKDDIVLFEVNMPLVASATDGGVLLSATACHVETIDRSAGTFTTSVDMSSPWSGTVYLYRSTDTDATTAGAATGLGITGFRGWMSASPSTLFGQNQALDTQRLAGSRFDGSTLSYREAVLQAVGQADRDGCKFDAIYLRPTAHAKLEAELGTAVRYIQEPAQGATGPKAHIGFEGIRISGPDNKTVGVYKDRWGIDGLGFALRRDTWTLRSCNKSPHILERNGLVMIPSATAPSYEIRWGGSRQLGCSNPGDNMVITLPT